MPEKGGQSSSIQATFPRWKLKQFYCVLVELFLFISFHDKLQDISGWIVKLEDVQP